MGKRGQRFWKQLGIAAMIVGLSILAYVIVVIIKEHNDPLIGVFILIVGIPAIAPSFLGYYMFKGSTKATWSLRVILILILSAGIILDTVIGLDVLSFTPVAIFLISFCVVWLILSFI
jgi:hypothetical protein